MGRAERACKIGSVAEIVWPTDGKVTLREACGRTKQRAKQYSMKQCLLHAATFARISDRLKAYDDAIRPIVMNDSGEFSDGWSGEAIESPQPEIAYGNTDVWFSPQPAAFVGALLQGGKLDWFQSSAAGIEHPVLVSIGKAARLYSTNHTQSEAMAEWALWAAFDFLRRGPERRENQAAKRYERMTTREINGSRWLVIGFGEIGAAVGRRVRALGGHVTGGRRSGGTSPSADVIVAPDAMDEALGAADVVLLCVPHTPATEGMANAGFLSKMKADALLLNLGRGALVVEDELIKALDAGKPAYAVLDVQSVEPLPDDSPLWTHPKILITPHDSSDTPLNTPRSDVVFLNNLERYLKEEPLKHVVDKASMVSFENGYGSR